MDVQIIEACPGCGQVTGVTDYDARLWDVYSRISDGRAHRNGLVFDGPWLDEHVQDDEDVEVLDLVMSKDMRARGLCATCGRPDLTGVTPDQILSEQDAQEMAEMAAERAAELRAGC